MALSTVRGERANSGNGRSVESLVGQDSAIVRLRAAIELVGRRDCTVLICGESGTGKELVARHLHAASPRAAGPFVTVDCTTLRDTLLESQLFGHVRGAFTGAEHATLGLFRAADGGTLFLDEIGETQPELQAKLLRCIQERAVVPLGAVEPIRADVRVIAATHRDLRALAREGRFREDLYFRLHVVQLDMPPLRDRPGDILPLADHLLQRQAALYGEPVKVLSEEAGQALRNYAWPGNVRELRNVLEHACVFAAGGRIEAADLPSAVRRATRGHARPDGGRVVPLEVAERCLIKRALRAAGGNRTRAAQLLGIERHRLARMIQRHRLEVAAPVARGSTPARA